MTNKEIVKIVVEAFLQADIEKVLGYMAEDVTMNWPGYAMQLGPGKDAIRDFFKDIPEMTNSSIGHIIADGNLVAGTGTVTSKFKDGSVKNSFFCDWYEFEQGKIKNITSYMVFEQDDKK